MSRAEEIFINSDVFKHSSKWNNGPILFEFRIYIYAIFANEANINNDIKNPDNAMHF